MKCTKTFILNKDSHNLESIKKRKIVNESEDEISPQKPVDKLVEIPQSETFFVTEKENDEEEIIPATTPANHQAQKNNQTIHVVVSKEVKGFQDWRLGFHE